MTTVKTKSDLVGRILSVKQVRVISYQWVFIAV